MVRAQLHSFGKGGMGVVAELAGIPPALVQ